mmetsp:Transcript_26579/g.61198  ORF Transcript_26579/g.61198 Transcript_26579/m.61198 type:complete len:89 (+) Transcript_26579:230-496(+)
MATCNYRGGVMDYNSALRGMLPLFRFHSEFPGKGYNMAQGMRTSNPELFKPLPIPILTRCKLINIYHQSNMAIQVLLSKDLMSLNEEF